MTGGHVCGLAQEQAAGALNAYKCAPSRIASSTQGLRGLTASGFGAVLSMCYRAFFSGAQLRHYWAPQIWRAWLGWRSWLKYGGLKAYLIGDSPTWHTCTSDASTPIQRCLRGL